MTYAQPPRFAGFFLALFLIQAVTVAILVPGMLNVGDPARGAVSAPLSAR
jgi:hypothetical protein